ncbi:twin-arginine translocase TatA/TatE family subunit [Streptomyces sp. PSKA01]|uniref:Twin-arginine translocase TatA/TatE family subunit n=2 Tax=Streptomyces cupreus TaxID=2759956 RepID=A0A7X1JCB0_9ACTN|nr:twin-arginine translocase TatA/TatE family subunit [Streptomyces cupreus]MBC2907639.1 twin-arginine translocase TatA/TatE family subunit [Streptomyces cupreus]
MFGLSELALILVVVIVVVGIKKLPELTRSAGKAARIFKSEAKALKEEGSTGASSGEGRVVPGAVVERDDPSARS